MSEKNINDITMLDPFIVNDELVYDNPNPFFIPYTGSKLTFVKTNILMTDYNFIHILCLKNDFEPTVMNTNKIQLFYEPDSDIAELKGQAKTITLLRGPLAMIQLLSIRPGLIEIGKEYLEYFNHQCYQLRNREIVYLMLETRKKNVKYWINLHEKNITLDKFIEQKIFSSYYNLQDKKMDNHMIELINQCTDHTYWQDDKNCIFNLDKSFQERKFNLKMFSKSNIPIEEIEQKMKKFLQNFKENETSHKCYPKEIKEPNINGSSKILSKNQILNNNFVNNYKSFYQITKSEELIMQKEFVFELLVKKSLSEKEKYYLICNLLISKDYCHYLLGDNNILTATQEIFEKYKPIIKYLMGYAWVALYKEECILRSRIKKSDRFVFDINTASILPSFPFCLNAPYMNPYFCLLVSNNISNYEHNIGGVKQYYVNQTGIVDLNEFIRRMNIFLIGQSKKNILEGVDWSNMVVSGGMMAAIIPKFNPLMMKFKKIPDPKISMTDAELDRFFQEYYNTSDIDFCCNHPNILDFIKHVKNVRNIICINLGCQVNSPDVRIEPNKTLSIFVNDKFLKEKCDKKEIPFDYQYIIENKNKKPVLLYFYEIYLERKKISNRKNRIILKDKIDDNEYFQIIDYCEFNKITLIINDYSFENELGGNISPEINSGLEMAYFVKNNNDISGTKYGNFKNSEESVNIPNIFIKFSETIRYNIVSNKMKHNFEFFRIVEKEFFHCIYKFHLPCVRSYYDGTNCYMLPSAISAYQTLTNIDFKYFVGRRDPIHIIDKYRKRGYSTILNKLELHQFISYVLSHDKFMKAYNVSTNNNVDKILGCIDHNNDYFKPRKMFPEDYNTKIKLKYLDHKTINQVITQKEIIKWYRTNYAAYFTRFLKKNSIASNGDINPVSRWMIDASYDLLK